MTNTAEGTHTLSMISHRLLGIGIILKAILPALIFTSTFLGLLQLTHNIGASINSAQAHVAPKLTQAKVELVEIKNEVKRLYGEVSKIKNKTAELTDDVQKSIEPIRQSLLGVANSLDFISNTVESLLNGIIGVINKLPGKDLRKIRLPSVKIPAFKLPSLDIDIDLNPDLAAIKSLQVQVDEISNILGDSLQRIHQAIITWLGIMMIVISCIGLWLLLVVISHCLKVKVKVIMGVKLIKGETIKNAILYF